MSRSRSRTAGSKPPPIREVPIRRLERRARLLLALALALALTLVPASAAAAPEDSDDERENFEASFFLGSAIDNFAASELSSYLNPDASGDPGVFERLIGGIQFAYRLAGKPGDERQLWIQGLTVHGVRSTDVDCDANPEIAVCEPFENETDPSGRFLYIVRNASSLEAAVALRWEFQRMHARRDHAASLYVGAQAGFVTVAGADDDLIDVHHAGFGAIVTEGRFRESYLELGYGRTDLFQDAASSRKKINALLMWTPDGWNQKVSGFARIVIDSDFGDGPDSIQSYFGLRFDLARLFPGKVKGSEAGESKPAESEGSKEGGGAR